VENLETNNLSNPLQVPTKSKAIFPVVVTAVVSLSLGLFVGYFVGINRPIKTTSTQNTPSRNNQLVTTSPPPTSRPPKDYSGLITPTPPPPKTITKIPGWLTYTNSVHKYSVQYPPDWAIDSSQADNQENYQDSVCCNTASLIISKGETKWLFYINQLYSGFDAPDECQPGPDNCSLETKDINVMGYLLKRNIYRQKPSLKAIAAYISTPGKLTKAHPGFGQVGITNQNVYPTHIKYFIDYEGPEIEKYLTTLDRISENLQVIE